MLHIADGLYHYVDALAQLEYYAELDLVQIIDERRGMNRVNNFLIIDMRTHTRFWLDELKENPAFDRARRQFYSKDEIDLDVFEISPPYEPGVTL